MRKRYIIIFIFLLRSLVYSAGLSSHQHMADIGKSLVSEAELVKCLGNNRDAYLAGAYFPDSGYITNREMALIAHETPFIDAFVQYIKNSYNPPFSENYPLISYMLGIASHIADDGPYHQGFITAVAEHDFNGDWAKAHTYCDTGVDLLQIVDFNRWRDIPEVKIPVKDLLNVYEDMGYKFEEMDIIVANKIMHLAEYGERLICLEAYPILKWKMPWGSENYYNYPDGGFLACGGLVANYYEDIWSELMSFESRLISKFQFKKESIKQDNFVLVDEQMVLSDPLISFSKICLNENIVKMEIKREDSAFVSICHPQILDQGRFYQLLQNLIEKINNN